MKCYYWPKNANILDYCLNMTTHSMQNIELKSTDVKFDSQTVILDETKEVLLSRGLDYLHTA